MTVASATKTIASKLSRKLRGDLVNVIRTFSSFAVATAYLFYSAGREHIAGKRLELRCRNLPEQATSCPAQAQQVIYRQIESELERTAIWSLSVRPASGLACPECWD
jgi:hypothetical protein